MNLWIRLFYVVIAALLRKPLHPFDESLLKCRVFPTDLDLNMHMNNGRYLTVMDLGRIDLIVRAGMGRMIFRKKWAPLVGGVMIKYRQSLAPFDTYVVRTKLVGWTPKWFILEQRFERGHRLIAVAHVKTLFRANGARNVPAKEVLAELGIHQESPVLPEFLKNWQD